MIERPVPDIAKGGVLITAPRHVEEMRKAAESNESDKYRNFRRLWSNRLDEIKRRFFGDGLITLDWEKRKIPTPPVAIEDERNWKYLASYRIVPDGYGLNDKLTLNEQHIIEKDGEYTWDMGERALVGTIIHELAHEKMQRLDPEGAYDPKRGKKETHSKQMRKFLKGIGINCNSQGQHYLPDDLGSPIDILCNQWGLKEIEYPAGTEFPINLDWFRFLFDPQKQKKGRSSLSLWECQCIPPQRARIGKAEFFAVCPICSMPFTRKT